MFKFISFLAMLPIVINLSTIKNIESKQSEELYRVYAISIGKLNVGNEYTSLKGYFYSDSGYEYNIIGNIHEPKLNAKFQQETLFSFDIPTKSKVNYFQVTDKQGTGIMTQTPLYKIENGLFILDLENYFSVNENNGWKAYSINPELFASYILSNINPYKEDAINGFLSYPILTKCFMSDYSDYNSEVLQKIEWYDEYLAKNTTLLEKIAIVESNYNLYISKKSIDLNFIFNIIAVPFLAVPPFLLIYYFHWRKKNGLK